MQTKKLTEKPSVKTTALQSLFKFSPGGASVHYLTLSPMAKGLYKNAISLSGSALCWWANIPHPREQAVRLANHFQCPDAEDNAQIGMNDLNDLHFFRMISY